MAYPSLKTHWTEDDLADHFNLQRGERRLLEQSLEGVRKEANRLGFAVLLKTYQFLGRPPRSRAEVPGIVVGWIARQLDVDPAHLVDYSWKNGVWKRHLQLIRKATNHRAMRLRDFADLEGWLFKQGDAAFASRKKLFAMAVSRCRDLRLELPAEAEMRRRIAGVWRSYFERVYEVVASRIDVQTRRRMNRCLKTRDDGPTLFDRLKSLPRAKGPKTTGLQVEKLNAILAFKIEPAVHFAEVPSKVLSQLRDRAKRETASQLRRHPPAVRYTLLAAFLHARRMQVTDDLITLFLHLIHGVEKKAKASLEKDVVKNVRAVYGKEHILYKIALAVTENPADESVQDVIFPEVGEDVFHRLVEEYAHKETRFDVKRAQLMQTKYSRGVRAAMKPVLNALKFRANSHAYRPLLGGLDLVRRYWSTNHTYYPEHEKVPIGVADATWQELSLEEGPDGPRVLKQRFELCVLLRLEQALRCKEVWVEGSYRYRNPDEDLPADWEEQRAEYYRRRNLPLEPDGYLEALKRELEAALESFNDFLASPRDVSICRPARSKKGTFHVPKVSKRPERPLIQEVKKRVLDGWGILELIDILVEADRRVDFGQFFQTSGQRQIMSPEDARERLLLTVFALGTNTGLKRAHAATKPECTYQDLRYFRNRFVTADALRDAIAALVNRVLELRNPEIWGRGTACASDGKHLGAWDQNLMTEWNPHYKKNGVMIYWHVDKNSLCIYSKLKTCSSSEVAAMLEGLLRHDSEMRVERNFTDSHGQSEVAFAFCRLLGFELMPRLKRIKDEKLYLPGKNTKADYPNLAGVLERPIRWDVIRRQWDDIVRHVVALAEDTGPVDSILRRFNKYNRTHPTYKALIELGKALKTIFLCRYLSDPALRVEVHEGLNVVENWNSSVEFIFYARKMEMQTNDPEMQELAVLCLHLLQNALILTNTILVESVLKDRRLRGRFQAEDFRAITPLFTNNVNPYGSFDLDLTKDSFLEAA